MNDKTSAGWQWDVWNVESTHKSKTLKSAKCDCAMATLAEEHKEHRTQDVLTYS